MPIIEEELDFTKNTPTGPEKQSSEVDIHITEQPAEKGKKEYLYIALSIVFFIATVVLIVYYYFPSTPQLAPSTTPVPTNVILPSGTPENLKIPTGN